MNLLIMFFINFTISILLLMINFLIAKKKINQREKFSPYECGFDPISSPRLPFSIQFYTIAIIFLIFDIELLIFIPMISNLHTTNSSLSWLQLSSYFIFILLLGLYIEWNDGALKWLK